jgi:hypothetical protein
MICHFQSSSSASKLFAVDHDQIMKQAIHFSLFLLSRTYFDVAQPRRITQRLVGFS